MELYEILCSIIFFNLTFYLVNLINFNKIKNFFNICSFLVLCALKVVKYKTINLYNKYFNNYIVYDKNNNIIKIEYKIKHKKYIFCQELGKIKTTRILNCSYKNEDKTEELMLFLGPNKDFHGQKFFCPRFMGYDELEINYFTEDFEIETKIYNKDDNILL
jgi:hypothetical protein